MDIKGHKVRRVLVASGADIAREFYFSVLLDRSERRYLAMCSVDGGMDIETLAKERPEALAKVAVDPNVGIDEAKAREIASAAGFDAETGEKAVPVLLKLWDVYSGEDATLVEVNPLVLTEQGEIVALDGKVTLDDNARFRHSGHEALVDKAAEDPLEAKAKALGLNYVKLDGQVGVIGNGAGLVMSTLDVVAYAGEEYGVGPANFLDIGGGADANVMSNGLAVILGDPDVRSVFVNVFGGITACDEVAKGIVAALDALGGLQADRRAPRRQRRRRRPRDPRPGEPPPRHPRRHDGRSGGQGRPAGRRVGREAVGREVRSRLNVHLPR